MNGTRTNRRLSTFDRVGVVIVGVIGTLAGLVVALGSHIILTPLLVMLFPGLLAGWSVAQVFGTTAGVIACGVANGAVCGFLLYAWDRLANAIASCIPNWSKDVAIWWLERRR